MTAGLDGPRAALARGIGLEPGKYVFGCPAATVSTPHKAWPVDNYVELARHLLRSHGLPVLAAGIENETALLDEIVERGVARGVSIARWTGHVGDMNVADEPGMRLWFWDHLGTFGDPTP